MDGIESKMKIDEEVRKRFFFPFIFSFVRLRYVRIVNNKSIFT